MKSTRHLIAGDDGLPAEEVGVWAIEKHEFLKRSISPEPPARNSSAMEMPAPPISISFAAQAALAFVKQVRGLMAAPYRHGKSAKKGARPFPKYSSRISTRPDGRHASSVCDARERPFES
jgi:hypothetical protein